MTEDTLEFLAELEKLESPTANNDELVPPGERDCPICKQKMHVEFQHGVAIDVCQEHGVWLDLGELRSIISHIRTGARIDRRTAIQNAKREGKVSGMVFGAWSLMLD